MVHFLPAIRCPLEGIALGWPNKPGPKHWRLGHSDVTQIGVTTTAAKSQGPSLRRGPSDRVPGS
jgi:hypothetical protein